MQKCFRTMGYPKKHGGHGVNHQFQGYTLHVHPTLVPTQSCLVHIAIVSSPQQLNLLIPGSGSGMSENASQRGPINSWKSQHRNSWEMLNVSTIVTSLCLDVCILGISAVMATSWLGAKSPRCKIPAVQTRNIWLCIRASNP